MKRMSQPCSIKVDSVLSREEDMCKGSNIGTHSLLKYKKEVNVAETLYLRHAKVER
jgi:hypothetical protein